ncbi:hypothetical protein BDB00DRAFT_940644 [Zychaea mexicana]|uniref:uncharacterized protein n=1 Tax=Zychaea mexicana TaxID=64656 RepID=UPI0022FE13C2|nr:uncharacterized protein BDB00DRAFT_940644 [Zychaea mexicana]KAI9491003.1 hypothetical protein BDB00DRAFT_940644 [Zychaea mexicana]
MGKPPKQPKVKGLKPASSSRAADLASSGSVNALSFQNLGGFAQFASAIPGSPVATPGSDVDTLSLANSLDAELVVILKKISKRDAVTKLKALEELEAYLKANKDAVPAVVSSWTKMYTKLTIEVDRRVRLAANNVHLLISTNAKKKLAPHLKEFIGAWLITMFDQSPDVARAARNSFEIVFSEDKRQGVLEFCQKDILEYVTEMILSKTPDTLSDPRHITKEDMTAKFARVISCCFYCVCHVIEKLPEKEREKHMEDYDALFDSPTLWKFAGHNSPIIRKSVYRLTKTLLIQWKGILSTRLNSVCSTLFASFLTEKEAGTFSDMWDAILLLTKEFPEAWLIAGRKKAIMPKFFTFLRGGLNGAVSIGYPSILVIIANLPSEIRSEHSFYKELFTNFWKGVSSEFIDQSNSDIFINAYAECIVYASVSKSNSDTDRGSYLINEIFLNLMKTSFASSKEFSEEKAGSKFVSILTKHLSVLATTQSVKDYMPPFWSELENFLIQTVIDCTLPRGFALDFGYFCHNVGSFFIEIRNKLDPVSEKKSSELFARTTGFAKRLVLAAFTSSLVYKDKAPALLQLSGQILNKYWDCLDEASLNEITEQAKILLPLLSEDSQSVLESLSYVYVGLMSRISDAVEACILWNLAIKKISDIDCNNSQQAKALVAFLEQLKNSNDYQSAELDAMFEKYIVHQLATPSEVPDNVLQHLGSIGLNVHLTHPLFSEKACSIVLASFHKKLHEFLEQKSATKDETLLKSTLSVMVILENIMENTQSACKLLDHKAAQGIATEVFESMFVDVTDESQERLKMITHAASTVWDMICTSTAEEDDAYRSRLFQPVLLHIKDSITDVTRSESPSAILHRVDKLLSSFYTVGSQGFKDALVTLLGDPKGWEIVRAPFSQHTSNLLTLNVLDKYVGLIQTPPVDSDELMPVSYDTLGLSAYGRLIFSVAEYVVRIGPDEFFDGNDREWIMQHLMLSSVECQYGLDIPGSSRIWNSSIAGSTPIVLEFLQRVNYIFDYRFETVLVTESGHSWYKILYSAVTNPGSTKDSDSFMSFVAKLMRTDTGSHGVETTLTDAMSGAVVESVLRKLVTQVGLKSDSVPYWLGLVKAEATELKLPIKVAVTNAIKNEISQEAGYKNLQSDLTSKLSGISNLGDFADDSGKAWKLLVLLNATALEHGDAISIPPQRLMHLVLTIRKWFEDDSALDDFELYQRARILVQLAQLFIVIAKSVKDVSGGQWEFFLERSYEWVTYSDPQLDEELPFVHYAAQLFSTLKNLAYEGIADLFATLDDQGPQFYETLLKLFIKEGGLNVSATSPTKPKIIYQELLADLVEDVPSSVLLESSNISDIAVLLKASNEALQKRAFKLLEIHVTHIVQELSVRLEFSATNDDDNQDKANIEKAIFEYMINPPDFSNWHSLPFDEQALHDVFGYMLVWLIMFDHFTNITFRLKQEYTAQLKDAAAVAKLMPFVFKILGVGVGPKIQPFDLSLWEIDEYEVDGFDSAHEISYQVMAAHLYYRALKHIPSLIRQWWVDCKNRQLTIGVENYTEKNFSAMLINSELDLLARDDIKTLLEDNDSNEFTVKALRAASEVSATYRVDEQDMQIAIKLPSNFPLRQIDVEGVQKVGVSDKQWRGWMFSVAAVIGSQNGNIVDALTVFKRNVNLHFGGVEDCTICYSIISAQDRSIPRKQCRTCKNKFHASCLYKWFRSSNSASCPLCRTVF